MRKIKLLLLVLFSFFGITLSPARESHPLYLAIVWNHHQPSYQGKEKGFLLQPWVRLHAAKDYYRMAALLKKYPAIKQTFNLTPILVEQLLTFQSDPYLEISRKETGDLTPKEQNFIRDNFFVVPRFFQKGYLMDLKSKKEKGESFSSQELLDLVTLFNLSWIDPAIISSEPELTRLYQKGKGFTEFSKNYLLDYQLKLLKATIPLYKELAKNGQAELISTPFYHPILPLLIDSSAARRASPGILLPQSPFVSPHDAESQIEKALDYHKEIFGRTPRGLWPSELAVSPETISLLAGQGIEWSLTDEKLLEKSLGKTLRLAKKPEKLPKNLLYLPGESSPVLLYPEKLYTAYRMTGSKKMPVLFFRDALLSDLIGFYYSELSGEKAALDLIKRLKAVKSYFKNSPQPQIVTIALDGENAWENYPQEKNLFLETLYAELSRSREIKTITPSEFLALNFKPAPLSHLATGSWNQGNLERWIGTPSKNRYWELLAKVRKDLVKRSKTGDFNLLYPAWEAFLQAEGSDFPWWFDSVPYPDALPFAGIFKNHLERVYRALGEKPPEFLKAEVLVKPEVCFPGIKLADKPLVSLLDPEGDDRGPGYYTYPTDQSFAPNQGIFDLLRYQIFEAPEYLVWALTFKELTDPWYGPSGFSHQLIDIYISQGMEGGNSPYWQGCRLEFSSLYPWSFAFRGAGFPKMGGELVIAPEQIYPQAVKIWADLPGKTVYLAVPKKLLAGIRGIPTYHYVLIGSADGFSFNDYYREIKPKAGRWNGGGGKINCPRVYDLLNPKMLEQEKMLGNYNPKNKARILPVKLVVPE